MTEQLYPLLFQPQLKDYVWGGRNLESLYGRSLPAGIIAESWEISGHPNGPTTVLNGELTGQTLPQVLASLGEKLVGSNAQWALQRDKFPLLIKLLDANKNLSVQVHPKDDYAQKNENGELGKTEMWYVLHAEPGAQLIFGVKKGVTPESFRAAIDANTLEDQLHYLPVKAGDTVFVEAGSVHALMEGTLVAEIQQNSDVTYRVYDWGRMGADGTPRPLHIDRAMDVINFEQVEPGPYQPKILQGTSAFTRTEISRSEYFVVENVALNAGQSFHGCTDGDSMEIWGVVQGQCQLSCPNAESVDLPAIQFCLVPAALGAFTVTARTDNATLLRVYLP